MMSWLSSIISFTHNRRTTLPKPLPNKKLNPSIFQSSCPKKPTKMSLRWSQNSPKKSWKFLITLSQSTAHKLQEISMATSSSTRPNLTLSRSRTFMPKRRCRKRVNHKPRMPWSKSLLKLKREMQLSFRMMKHTTFILLLKSPRKAINHRSRKRRLWGLVRMRQRSE